jgi:hypothetical protein
MNTCGNDIQYPISEGNFDIYDLRAPTNDTFPPETYVSYLQESSIQTQIGARQLYQECADAPSEMLDSTGDCRPASVMYMYSVMSAHQFSRYTQLPLYPQHSGTERHSSSHLGR